ncbi:type II toxin-antitoxin system death-on-curing family toxin [Moraxella nasovis]|uniref:type II toxin-antitoxin system death-on-curing family toxin n=1 Tax=Moraxella nasovis TaxID=2904121 RepID=UPI001F61DD5D|nr:type II toxin-antitoxin system death-on-curing family toxin [Moraxella nasovis]UNU73644.1 type II toxin-antitoxin system death-on-curing family toxin [Moraxella nasovis]
MIDIDFVIAIHDEILANEKGLKGIASMASLESCLSRIDNQMSYEPLDNVYLIGAFYAVALAKAHAFNDGNKRTALVVMLTYLDMQGINIAPNSGLDDLMVKVASSEMNYTHLADILKDLTV